MEITKSTYELLTPIIAAIDKTIAIQSVVDNGNSTYKLNVCNSLWATIGFPLTIHGETYKIIAIVPNVSITVSGTVLPTKGYFDLYLPKFYHGTITATEVDLNAKVNNNLLSSDKMPMIWLHEPVDEINDPQDENSIARFSDCDLFFMVDANFSTWSNAEHFTQAIKPMRQLIAAFYTALKKSGSVNDNLIDTFKTTDLPRFGRYTAYSTQKTTIFAQYEMSGTKVKINIPFIRNQKNCCNG